MASIIPCWYVYLRFFRVVITLIVYILHTYGGCANHLIIASLISRLTQILRHVPFLEELKLSNIPDFSPEHVEIIARRCPRLASLAINNLRAYEICCQPVCNQLASAIAKYMPQLCCLQLCGNRMTNAGLSAILHNCQHLEYLDIRQCYNIFVVLDPNLMTKVRKQIKHMRFSKVI